MEIKYTLKEYKGKDILDYYQFDGINYSTGIIVGVNYILKNGEQYSEIHYLPYKTEEEIINLNN